MEILSDSALMERVQAGDTAEFALLFERYHLGVFRYVLHLTNNRALSEDLVQEVFFRALKYARSFDGRLSFPAWIYSMARNAYFDSVRKGNREISNVEAVEVRSPEPMPEEVIARKQDVAFLEEALQQLPRDKREVLVWSRYQNLGYEEIARILECEVGAVKVRVYRALKELRGKFCDLRGEKLYDA